MKGLQSHRLYAGNPREVIFSELWEKEVACNLMEHLLKVSCDENDPDKNSYDSGWGWYKKPLGDIQERDNIIAATIVQWLGSPVGFSFLSEALEKCGYGLVWQRGGK